MLLHQCLPRFTSLLPGVLDPACSALPVGVEHFQDLGADVIVSHVVGNANKYVESVSVGGGKEERV